MPSQANRQTIFIPINWADNVIFINISTDYKKSLIKKAQLVLDRLNAGEHCRMTPKDIGGKDIITIKLNRAARMIFNKMATLDGQHCLIFTEIIPNHEYHKSQLERSTILPPTLKLDDYEKNGFIKLNSNVSLVAQNTDLEDSLFYQNKWVQLSEPQLQVCNSMLPLLCTGGAGSGKTLLALKYLLNIAIQANEAEEKTPIKLFYTTKNKHLVKVLKQQWMFIAESEDIQNIKVDFYTLDELLQLHAINEEAISYLAEKTHCLEFISSALSKPEAPVLSENEIYQEWLLSAAILNRDYIGKLSYSNSSYNALGIRQSTISPEIKQWIYETYVTWKNKDQIHLPFYTLSQAIKEPYEAGVADEIADFSSQEILNTLKLVKNNNIGLFGDGHQCLTSHRSIMPFIIHWFKQNQIDLTHIALPDSHRMSVTGAKLYNQLLALKIRLNDGLIDNTLYCEINEPEKREDTARIGKLEVINPEDEKLKVLENSPDCAVIVFCEEDKIALKKYVTTPLVFLPEEIKGLEFKYVVICNLDSISAKCDISRRMQDMKIPLDSPLQSKSTRAPQKYIDDVYKEIAIFLARLNVGISRASQNLYFINISPQTAQSKKRSAFLEWFSTQIELINQLSKVHAAQEYLPLQDITLENWLPRLKELYQNGNLERVKEILIDIFKMKPTEAKGFIEKNISISIKPMKIESFGNLEEQTNQLMTITPQSTTSITSACSVGHEDDSSLSRNRSNVSLESPSKKNNVVQENLSLAPEWIEKLFYEEFENDKDLANLIKHKDAEAYLFVNNMKNGNPFFVNICLNDKKANYFFYKFFVAFPDLSLKFLKLLQKNINMQISSGPYAGMTVLLSLLQGEIGKLYLHSNWKELSFAINKDGVSKTINQNSELYGISFFSFLCNDKIWGINFLIQYWAQIKSKITPECILSRYKSEMFVESNIFIELVLRFKEAVTEKKQQSCVNIYNFFLDEFGWLLSHANRELLTYNLYATENPNEKVTVWMVLLAMMKDILANILKFKEDFSIKRRIHALECWFKILDKKLNAEDWFKTNNNNGKTLLEFLLNDQPGENLFKSLWETFIPMLFKNLNFNAANDIHTPLYLLEELASFRFGMKVFDCEWLKLKNNVLKYLLLNKNNQFFKNMLSLKNGDEGTCFILSYWEHLRDPFLAYVKDHPLIFINNIYFLCLVFGKWGDFCSIYDEEFFKQPVEKLNSVETFIWELLVKFQKISTQYNCDITLKFNLLETEKNLDISLLNDQDYIKYIETIFKSLINFSPGLETQTPPDDSRIPKVGFFIRITSDKKNLPNEIFELGNSLACSSSK